MYTEAEHKLYFQTFDWKKEPVILVTFSMTIFML